MIEIIAQAFAALAALAAIAKGVHAVVGISKAVRSKEGTVLQVALEARDLAREALTRTDTLEARVVVLQARHDALPCRPSRAVGEN